MAVEFTEEINFEPETRSLRSALHVEPKRSSLLNRVFETARPVGEAIIEVGKDIAAIPGRALTSAKILGQAATEGPSRGLEAIGLIDEPLVQPVASPEEARSALLGSAVDALIGAIPAGRIAKGTGLGARTLRSAATLGKFEALTPPREEPTIEKRALGAARGGAIGAAFPVAGGILGPLASKGQALFSQGVQQVAKILERPVAEKVARSTSKRLEALYFRSFFGRTPKEVIEIDLPKLFQPIAKELRGVLSDAGKVVDANITQLAETGTIAARTPPGKALSDIARKQFEDVSSVLISENRVKSIKAALLVVDGAMKAAAKRLGGQATPELTRHFQGFVNFYEALVPQFLQQRRAAGKILQSFQQEIDLEVAGIMASHLERIGIRAQGGQLPDVFATATRTGLQQITDEVRAGLPAQAAGTFVRRIWRPLLFPLTSLVADTFTNTLRLGQKAGESVIDDVFDVVVGRQAVSSSALARAIWHSARVRKPSELADTALGAEFQGAFGKLADPLLVTGAVGKRAADSQFAKVGFFHELYKEALKESANNGLRGAQKTAFIRKFVSESPVNRPDLIQKAVDSANNLRFFDKLSGFENAVADNPAVMLLFNPFMRFQFQFARWLAEFTPFSPSFVRKLARNEATAKDLTNFAIRNMTGLGSLYFVDQTIYDNIDFDTMEYVDPASKERFSFTGLDPLPTLVGLTAIFRGEGDKAFKSFERGAGWFFTQEGLASGFFETIRSAREGVSSEKVIERFEAWLSSAIPGRAILGALAGAFDPVRRKGFGRAIPFAGKPVIDPLTGQPARQQRAFGLPGATTNIPAPAAFGSRLTTRRLNELEQLLTDLEIPTRFPSPIGLINPLTNKKFEKSSEIPANVRREFEIAVGEERNKRLSTLNLVSFRKLPKAIQKRRIEKLRSDATEVAKHKLNARLRAGRSIGSATIDFQPE